MDVKVRKFSPKDISIVMEIEKHCYPKKPWSEKEFMKWYEKFPEGFLIAEVKGEPVGYIVITKDNIPSIVVKKDFRRQGIGKILVNEGIKNLGVKELKVHVRVSNKTVQEFNKKLGFKQIGLKKGYYKNGEDAIEMIKVVK